MPLQIRRGTNAERLLLGPSDGLVVGEILYVTDTQRLYIGSGLPGDHQGVSVTGYTSEDAVDAVGAALVAGNHANISFTYGAGQDTANRIDATVDLSNYTGTITADAFKGSVYGDDTTLLIDGVLGRIVAPVFADVTGNVTGNLNGNVVGNLLGNVSGNLLGNVAGNLLGDIKGSVFGDDSTVIVNGITNTLHGTLVGNITTEAGSSILNTASKAATLNSIALESTGLITGDSMTVTVPSVAFVTSSTTTTTPFVSFFSVNAGANAAPVSLTRSRGSLLSPTTLLNSDEVGSLIFSGFTSSGFAKAAGIVAIADNTVSAGVLPSRIEISVNNSSGSSAVALTVSSASIAATVPVKVPVYADDTARNTAIASPTAGMIIVNGTTFQGYNGSSWVPLS
jgi:hypothetical protein